MVTVVTSDPPWKFGDKLPGRGRGAEKHYECLDVPGIVREMRPVTDAAGPDAVLFLWRVAAMQQEALYVVELLGFELKSELVWVKTTATGKRHFGMGRYVRASHETCLIARRGRAFPESRSVRSVFEAPAGAHSRKPEAFFALVDELYPSARKVECFARVKRHGWEQHGNEVGKLGVVS